MRLTVLRQTARSLPPAPPPDDPCEVPAAVTRGEADAALERIKHFLWHGNTFRALDLISDLAEDLDCLDQPTPTQQSLLAKLTDLRGYIDLNAAQIPNYGERHRCGEPISSAVAESTVNQVISRRMVKKQQMRWTPAGAHLLLQVRTRVLNNDLTTDFERWYPGFTQPTSDQAAA